MKKLILHLVSDSSGQTVRHTANTAIAKFQGIDVKKYHWPMIRNEKMLHEALEKVKSKPGIVLYTISDTSLRDILKKFCYERKIPCISVVSKIVKGIEEYLGIAAAEAGYINKFDSDYFDKVKAIDYTLRHDDGQSLEEIEEADIILIGPSRTSKTPTSVYLAYNGFKTANIPLIYDCPFPDSILSKVQKPMICGLVTNPHRLIEIRESRMNLLQVKENTNYTDMKIVQDECRQIKKLCYDNGWKIIDISMRSIEETSAIIMKSYYEHKKRI